MNEANIKILEELLFYGKSYEQINGQHIYITYNNINNSCVINHTNDALYIPACYVVFSVDHLCELMNNLRKKYLNK